MLWLAGPVLGKASQEEPCGHGSLLLGWTIDHGQGRLQERAEIDVVEADQRYFRPDRDPEMGERLERPDCHGIVGAEHGRWRLT